MDRNFLCGTCRNFEEEHRLCRATVLLRVAIFSGIFFLSILCAFYNNSSNAGGARLTLSILQYPINHLIRVQ